MDIKINGLTTEILEQALAQAREGRMAILERMLETLSEPRAALKAHAPRILTVQVDPEKIGTLIGPGGKNVRGIQEETGAKIDIDDDGRVFISCADGPSAEKARAMIESMTGASRRSATSTPARSCASPTSARSSRSCPGPMAWCTSAS